MRAFGREGSLGSTMGKDTEEKWRNQILSGMQYGMTITSFGIF